MFANTSRDLRVLAVTATLALVGAACSKGTTAANPSPSMSEGASMSGGPSMSSGPMMMQPGADKMHSTIESPASGFVLTGNTLALTVKTSGYDDSCAWAGKEDKQGVGHYHVLLDGALVNMSCAKTFDVSMQNVSPGQHTIEVVPAQDDHTEIMGNADKIPFTYQPSNPLPEITSTGAAGKPGITILSPKAGATLSGTFTVKVAFSNFTPACNLMGKPDVTGFGHWHVNIDSMSGPMMGMGTMLGMSCTRSFVGTTVGMQPGSTHTLIALLTDNGHAPLGVDDHIQFTVGA
jgi:hypothetical protein